MTRVVVLIRHAEKPAAGEPGFDPDGQPDPDGLTIRGWQRAGALVPLFAGHAGRRLDDRLPLPAALFAAADAGRSRRPEYTLQPLAAALRLPLVTLPSNDDDAAGSAPVLLAAPGPALVCWRHRELPQLAAALLQNEAQTPSEWPADCYDQAWVCTQDENRGWRFDVVAI